MFYSDEVIEEVREQNDIVSVISDYVKLTRKGSSYFGLCPFHNEKSASFSVSQTKQMYYCFGCGAGGNVYTFMMEYENFTFAEALKTLAERVNYQLPEIEYSKEAKQEADLKATLFEINKLAARYYYYTLKSEQGQRAMDYLKQRELLDDTILNFGLGYSGKYGDELYKFLKSKGYKDDILKQTGLFNIDSKGFYDRFRNRVMYPIMNVNNKVIGFGGRVMGDGEPKYLNSPETKLFDKSRNLYGLNVARASRKPNIIICEGYMDVISLHQAGFNQAVASLGTALTTNQAAILKRYTDHVLLTYDSDGAGTKAALRAIPILREAGLSVKVINMKPYKDPDEFIKALGKEEFQNRIDNATNSFMFEVDIIEKKYDLKDPDAKTSFFKEVAEKLTEFSEELERTNYIEAIANKYMISFDSLKKLVNMRGMQLGIEHSNKVSRQRTKENTLNKEDALVQSQRVLLTWLIEDISLFKKLENVLEPKDFVEPLYNKVATLLYEQYANGKISPAGIINRFENESEHKEVAALFNTSLDESLNDNDREKALNETLQRVKNNSFDYRKENADSIKDLQAVMKEQAEFQKKYIHLN